VQRYRLTPQTGGLVLGAWYRPGDWDDDGNLIATGRAAARALDPWANTRHKGVYTDPLTGKLKPVPPLRFEGVDYPDEEPASDTAIAPVVQPPAEPVVQHVEPVTAVVQQAPTEVVQQGTDGRAAYQQAYQRDRRAAEKAGLTVTQWRAQQAPPVALIPENATVREPALGVAGLREAA
jgi:hypothetical protein